VWSRNLVKEEAMTRVGLQRHKRKKKSILIRIVSSPPTSFRIHVAKQRTIRRYAVPDINSIGKLATNKWELQTKPCKEL
jgi:hypothetical protein